MWSLLDLSSLHAQSLLAHVADSIVLETYNCNYNASVQMCIALKDVSVCQSCGF